MIFISADSGDFPLLSDRKIDIPDYVDKKGFIHTISMITILEEMMLEAVKKSKRE